jgi:hypothetical protein
VLYPVELRMQRGRYPIGDMNTNHDKPLIGVGPTFIGLQPIALTTWLQGQREVRGKNINKNLSPWNKTPLTMSNLS